MARASYFLLVLIGIAAGPYWVAAGSESTPLYCDPPHAPKYGDYDGERRQYYPLGMVINYHCDQGYTLDGNPWTVCAYGTQGPYWIYDAPVCKPIECSILDSPQYGHIQLTGTSVGSRAEYSCSKGFTLVGERWRECQPNREWSGQTPVCKHLQCDTLRDISSGRVVLSGTTVGSTATYSCNKGYILYGEQTRTCLPDGEWTGEEPFCELPSCKLLQDISNGRVVLSGTTVGSTASYSCDKGYILFGDQTRTCLPDGEWSGEEPFCELPNCENLRDISNGRVVLSGTTVGSTATYSCNKDYILFGDQSRTCQFDGQWTGQEPYCELLSCDTLQDISSGRVVLSGTTVGSTATYSCNKGYILVGDQTRTCQFDGEWTGREPYCKLRGCNELQDISSGRVVLSGTTVGSTATYSCNKGYFLVGDQTRTCQFDGEWTGREPFCELVRCKELQDISNGRVELSGTTLGSTATYSCNKGYILFGDQIRTCLPDGEWSGEEPFCELLSCDTLQDISNGRVALSGTTVGSTATYSCNKGYILFGEQTRICLPDGEWSGEEPFCELFSCDTLRDISSGRVVLTGTTVGSTATYSCNKGYILVGDQTRTCQFDGEWTGREPYCQLLRCKELQDISSGRVVLSGTTVGSTATYSCNKGYVLYGEQTRICLPDGEWSGEEPFCELLRCEELQDISSGRVVLSGTTVGSTATYSCNKGYILVGDYTRSCQFDGEWSGEEPFCERILLNCDELRDISNGRVALSGTTVGSTATYSCNKGYFLMGEQTRTCLPDGEWTGQDPYCQLVLCDRLYAIPNGKVVVSGSTVGSTATYICYKDYALVGQQVRTCQYNGQWTGLVPFCKDTIIDCGLTLEAPENGYAHVPCTRLGCTATYWCRSGYSLVGDLDSTRTCQANGYWSNYTPACQRDYY